MKKSQLKNGMILETRSGERGLVVKDNCYGQDALIFTENNWTNLDSFSEDLIWYKNERTGDLTCPLEKHLHSIDIMKVYQPDLPVGFLSRTSKFTPNGEMKLLWDREEEEKKELNRLHMEILSSAIMNDFEDGLHIIGNIYVGSTYDYSYKLDDEVKEMIEKEFGATMSEHEKAFEAEGFMGFFNLITKK